MTFQLFTAMTIQTVIIWALKMEVISSSETLVVIHNTIHRKPEHNLKNSRSRFSVSSRPGLCKL